MLQTTCLVFNDFDWTGRGLNSCLSIALAYSVDNYSHKHSSLFHDSVYVVR